MDANRLWLKVFDNLYCIGTKSVVAWALQTSDGIILIDSMWDNNDTQLIIDGMKKLGLNLKYILKKIPNTNVYNKRLKCNFIKG